MKIKLVLACLWGLGLTMHSQQLPAQTLEAAVTRLDSARTISDYRTLSNDFTRLANVAKTSWLPYYYAAYCMVRIAYLQQDNPEKISPYSDQAEVLIKKAQELCPPDDKKAQSEIYCVLSMVNRSRVFINMMANGTKYGIPANQFREKAQLLDPDNPRAMYLAATEKFYAPKAFGGNREQAKELLNQALTKLEQQPASSTDPHWVKSDCKALLSQF